MKYTIGLKSAGFRFQFEVPHMSSYTDLLWCNETVCLWMTMNIYMEQQVSIVFA